LLTLTTWAVGLLIKVAKLLFFFFFIDCTFWKAVAMCTPHLSNRKLCYTSLRLDYLHKLLAFFWMRYLSPLILRFIQSLGSIIMD
jgi:hypothetical protein